MNERSPGHNTPVAEEFTDSDSTLPLGRVETARPEYYFVGLTPPSQLSDRITEVQRDIYSRNSDRIIKPLQPHITMLPPPATAGSNWAELTQNIEVPDTRTLSVRLDGIEEVEAYPEHFALVFTVDSPGTTALREKLFHAVGREPSTPLHLTLCQPSQGRIPPEITEEYRQRLKDLIGSTFQPEGLVGFFDTGAYREYEPRPFGT